MAYTKNGEGEARPRANPKRRRSTLTADERAAARALARRGSSVDTVARAIGAPKGEVADVIRGARALLDAAASEYAALHIEASRVAASKGNSGPAEWALERLGVVEPAKTAEATGGVVVRVGIALPGLGLASRDGVSGAACSQVIEGQVDTGD